VTATGDPVAWHSAIAREFDARYRQSAAFRERLAVWSELIARHVFPGSTVLDAGCGSGVLSMVAAARGGSVLGFDASAEMLALADARRHGLGRDNVTFAQGSLDDLAFLANRQFDVILCSSVLEYMHDLWGTFEALAKHLAPGGTFILSLPNGASLYRKAERASFRLTGRPSYIGLVRHMVFPQMAARELASRQFEITELRYYAPTPLFSSLARPMGLARLTDHLFALSAKLEQ